MAKSRNINHGALERAHFLRIEQNARAVDQIYHEAVKEFSQLAKTVNFDPNKPFSFDAYPKTLKTANKLFAEMAGSVKSSVVNGMRAEWGEANKNNDSLVKSAYPSASVSDGKFTRFFNRNLDARDSFERRKTNGMNLSDRVSKQTDQFKSEIEMGLDLGLGQGKSAAALSRDLRSNLQDPEKLFRRVRDKYDVLHLSRNAKAYHPGQGVYRSSYKNAMRLTRTEINMAYRESDYMRWQQMDFIVGMEVRLSNNPNHCPVCAALAGRYPKDFKFTGWHPQCRCSAIPIFKSDNELDDDIMRILNDEPLMLPDESSRAITSMPAGYNKWMNDNQDRIAGAKSLPYFIRDNYVKGDVSKGLKFVVVEESAAKPTTLDLSKLIKGDIPTNREVKDVLLAYAELSPDDFRQGLGDVTFQKSRSYLMQHSMRYRPSDNTWVGQSTLTMSTHTFNGTMFEGGSFNAAEQFRSALGAIKKGEKLTFNQEYSIEAMWHEILHAKTKTPPKRLTTAQVKSMETVNQFVARHTYDGFIEKLGGKAIHKETILDKGYGYTSWISNFRERLKAEGIAEKTAIDELSPVLMSNYSKVEFEIVKFFSRHRKTEL
ncbi:hypothetical protein [Parapedobacter indicus]|uniref:Phage Mu protein F like protein n=1 Tax=Parapedobacter indicus TaxID=1477437 RepID=A0A1I3E237_9SPHI|nr:hypothetical protein [Parapedobacter indicus]PPL04937.1 hypothetical protein CLV26_101747 [Parapedobacter indicus]SFH93062.1 hypothetical protein SAMN05444682_101733 [Parapedobacter indicus]